LGELRAPERGKPAPTNTSSSWESELASLKGEFWVTHPHNLLGMCALGSQQVDVVKDESAGVREG
jgi:hypothetical protein